MAMSGRSLGPPRCTSLPRMKTGLSREGVLRAATTNAACELRNPLTVPAEALAMHVLETVVGNVAYTDGHP